VLLVMYDWTMKWVGTIVILTTANAATIATAIYSDIAHIKEWRNVGIGGIACAIFASKIVILDLPLLLLPGILMSHDIAITRATILIMVIALFTNMR